MILKKIKLRNFRNFSEKEIDFSQAINVIYGFNGQGKTNLLEAISVVCLSRSFRTRREAELIRFGQEGFQVEADILFDSGVEKFVQIQYSLKEGKKLQVDGERVQSIIDFFGTFPLVVLSPEDDAITTGVPAERRIFLNFILSLLDKKYLGLLQDFQKIVKQRNRILQEAGESRYHFSQKIEPWNESFYKIGFQITEIRRKFLREFEQEVVQIHQALSGESEHLEIRYVPSFRPDWDTYNKFYSAWEAIKNDEIRRGMSLMGPQRDDVLFLLNSHELRKFGSRGQHRTVLLALKIGLYQLLLKKRNETPIFLLDDVYSEIDDVREKAFNDFFLRLKQLFLTTHEQDIRFYLPDEFHKEIRYILVEDSDIQIKPTLEET